MRGQQLLKRAEALLGSLGTFIPVGRELARGEYTPRSAHYVMNKYNDAFDKRVDQLKPGAEVYFDVNRQLPKGDTFTERVDDVINNHLAYAGSTPASYPELTGNRHFININPKASREIYAHELGHLASQQTDIGRLASKLRSDPKLGMALAGSALLTPAASALIQEGDDDLSTSLALSSASMLPTLIDEGLATKNGLAIMDMAGTRATLGQRGRLAAGFLSYLAPAIVAGYGMNALGNIPEKLFSKEEQEKMIAN